MEPTRRGERPKAMRNLVRAAITAGVFAAACVSGSVEGLASCAALPAGAAGGVAAAPLQFVGTVTSTADQDRTATVHVDEVWTGQHLPPEVILRGSPDVGAAATSVDRHYHSGHQYLFVPATTSGPLYDDNSCTLTREFTSDVRALRPATVIRYPAAPGGPPLIPLAAVAAAFGGALVYAVSRVRIPRA